MDFSKREERMLKRWKRERVFEQSVQRRRGKPPFVFYEGPPTANGRPGIHHMLVRSMKDAFLRYKTMRGFFVPRRAGWDTHGLPVEIEVEKELGTKSKNDIERYGIARFNARAKKSVWRYKSEWENLTERIGFWIDQKHPYVTYENEYIESVWAILKRAHREKLLEEDFKVLPHCTRCGTSLSSHEVALGYKSTTEGSVYVKFKVRNIDGEQKKHGETTYILSWTTTPWTLPGNVALAVGSDIEYVLAQPEGEEEAYWVAQAVADQVLGRQFRVLERERGHALAGLAYEPLFDIPETRNDKSHRVYAADFVNTEEGTGVVHAAVMYGEDDYRLGERVGLPKAHTVGENGRFLPFVPDGLAGRYVKDEDTERAIIRQLSVRGLLFREKPHTHDYPFCWRCGTPLLYYAKQSWFLRMSRFRVKLIGENEKVRWIPGHLRDGRFGEWLREVKDWAISRERYWGTPLPIWRCEKNPNHVEVVGSVAEFAKRAPLKNRYVFLRHGHGTHNETGTLSCYPERASVKLTPRGRVQVARAAKKLRTDGGVDLIFSSDLRRARETAEIVGKQVGVAVRFDKRLREYDVGVFNGKTVKAHRDFLGSEIAQWTKRAEGGETWNDMRKRMVAFVRDCERKFANKTILIVSHGDPLFVLKGAMLGLSEQAFFTGVIAYPRLGTPEVMRGTLLPLNAAGVVDLHRPWVDDIEFDCVRCKSGRGTMRRVPELLDAWFDSGAMPFASQSTKPYTLNPKNYPADFICEAIDQTRGWFYTLLAIAVLSGKPGPYRAVLCTGHVLDKSGKKMSKSLGNAVDPREMIGRYGADAVRWYFFTVNQPGDPKRFDEKDIKDAMNRFVRTLWNTYVFWRTYAPQSSNLYARNPRRLPMLDRWIRSRLFITITVVRERMDAYDITAAARALEAFVVEDLSNWYVRRSRSRFQQPISREDAAAARAFLADILAVTARLAAPFAPFLADEIYRGVGKSASVHLEDFPKHNPKFIDESLVAAVQKEREVIAIAHAARREHGIPVRQPLRKVEVPKAVFDSVYTVSGILETTKAELNVKEVVRGEHVRLDTELTPALRAEGSAREFIRAVQELRKDSGLTPKDRIVLRWHAGEGIARGAFAAHAEEIVAAVRAQRLERGPKRARERFDAERETHLGGESVWFGIRRV